MLRQSNQIVRLAIITSVTTALLAAPAAAQTPIANGRDFHEELDIGEPGVPYYWRWDTAFFVLPNAATAARPWFIDTVEIWWGSAAVSPVTHGLGWSFLTSFGDDWNAPDSGQITTVYGHDANHGELEPVLTGLNPADPEYVPVSDETIITRHGNEYYSTEAMTVPIYQLPDLLPGHDLSMVDFSDPFTVVHVFRTYAPMNVVYFPCPSDMNNDGVQDLNDISMFIGSFLAGQFGADFNADGVYDLTDLVEFIDGFVAGCP